MYTTWLTYIVYWKYLFLPLLFYFNRCYLTTEPAQGPFRQEGSFTGILPKFMEIILNVISGSSRYQEPSNIWPTHIQRSLSCTLWSWEKFSQMAFLHLLDTNKGHSIYLHDATPLPPRRSSSTTPPYNFANLFESSQRKYPEDSSVISTVPPPITPFRSPSILICRLICMD